MKRYDWQIGALLSTGDARRALRRRDIVRVYRLLIEGGISRALIAELTGQHPAEVAEIAAGHRIDDYGALVRIAAGLGIPRTVLGLSFGNDELDYGPGASAPPDPVTEDWRDSAMPIRVRDTDVAALEDTTTRLRDLDRRHGSHPALHEVAVAHARYSEALLPIAAGDPAYRRLALAVCDARALAGWIALDVDQRRAAWDHFSRALLFGWNAQNEVAVMGAIQSVGRMDLHEAPDFALTVFQLALLNGSSTLTRAFLKADEGWAYALLGQADDAGQAISRAKSMFADADPASARPSWMETAQALPDLLSVTGAAQLQMGQLSGAVADLSQALAARSPADLRSRAIDGAALATAQLRAGQVDSGLRAGHQAVDAVRQVPSARAREALAGLYLELVQRSDRRSAELAERVAGLPADETARRLGMPGSMLQNYVDFGLIEPDLVAPDGHYRFDPVHAREQLRDISGNAVPE